MPVTKGQQAIRDIVRAMTIGTGICLPAGIYPIFGPIVRNSSKGREITMARWGMPSPRFALKGATAIPGSPISAMSPLPIAAVALASKIVVWFLTSFPENESCRMENDACMVRVRRDAALAFFRRVDALTSVER